jgi:hypothetical protein
LQGITIWILGFFSFLAGINAINAIILVEQLGLEGLWTPYLLGSLTGGIPVYVYLLISILATLVFLGGTSSKIVSEFSNKALLNKINSKVITLESGQKVHQKSIESLQARIFLVDESVESMRKEVAKGFGNQEEEIKQVQTKLVNKVDRKLSDVKDEMARQLSVQGEEIKEISNRSNRKSVKAIQKQQSEIADIKLKLEQLEDEFAKPKPQLTSKSDIEAVKGIGENTGNELREIGITNVGEIVLTDPAIIVEKTGLSEKMVEKLQGRAQLGMVSGLKEKDMVLLEEAGIINRKDLADQDPLELGRKINEAFKISVAKARISEAEKPTIEEIYSWVKTART